MPDVIFIISAEFVILTREAGGGSLSVAVEGPSKTDIELEDNKDGSCNILYYPTLPGKIEQTKINWKISFPLDSFIFQCFRDH